MVHMEITASPQSHKAHINILCGQTEEFLNAEIGGVHKLTNKFLIHEGKEAIGSQKTNSRRKQSVPVSS